MGRWQMYDDQKPSMRKMMQVILTRLLEINDPMTRVGNTAVLMGGLLHCPTGQKESIDTVVSTIFWDANAAASSLQEKVKGIIARFKENALNDILTDPNNPQNVHVRSYYKGILGQDLGISSSLTGFRERIGALGDPFAKNPLIPLRMFFDKVKPQTMTQELLKHVENQKDLDIQAERIRLEGIKPKNRTADWRQSLQAIKARQKQARLERTIFTQNIIEYVMDTMHVSPGDFGRYFTLDADGNPLFLHEQGARQLLIDLGYIVVAPHPAAAAAP
jgi:hypothetical protein